MSWITRLIGRVVDTDLGRKIIGKTASAVKTVIGKVDAARKWAEENAPEALSAVETGLEVVGLKDDVKTAYSVARELASLGESYGEGKLTTAKGKKRLKDIAVREIRKL